MDKVNAFVFRASFEPRIGNKAHYAGSQNEQWNKRKCYSDALKMNIVYLVQLIKQN